MTTHAAPYTVTADRAASTLTELSHWLGDRPRHLHGDHMRAYPTQEAADVAELNAGWGGGGKHAKSEREEAA
jgi:hypothetical protein